MRPYSRLCQNLSKFTVPELPTHFSKLIRLTSLQPGPEYQPGGWSETLVHSSTCAIALLLTIVTTSVKAEPIAVQPTLPSLKDSERPLPEEAVPHPTGLPTDAGAAELLPLAAIEFSPISRSASLEQPASDRPTSVSPATDPAEAKAVPLLPTAASLEPEETANLKVVEVPPSPPAPADSTVDRPTSQTTPDLSSCDPELGCLFVTPPTSPTPSVNLSNCDPELGCIYVNPPAAPTAASPKPQPTVYLIARLDYFRSSNIFSSNLDPIDSALVRPGISLFAAPAIGPNTYLVTSFDANLVRYSTQAQFNYNELRFRAGVLQRLSPTMFGEIGWGNQQLFVAGYDLPGFSVGERFLNDNGLRLELSRRDQLSPKLSLGTFYQLRIGFANPRDRSRIINSFVASLGYDFQPNLQAALDYQFSLANFTQVSRHDVYQQINLRLTYTATRNTQLNFYAGYSFGNSSLSFIDFDGLILGVSASATLGLF